MKKTLIFALLSVSFLISQAQVSPVAKLSGYILDKNNQRPLPGVSIQLQTGKGTTTDSSGFFRITTAPGTYNVSVSSLNYITRTINNIVLTSGNESTISIELEPLSKKLDEIVIVNKRSSARATSLESPLSIQRMTTEEIKRNPGGNFDISKVIQSLPGVGGGVGGGGYRNDIVIRGGAPSENVYYLDGIEIPILNHFGTQGSGGGPQGILNANFIEEVKVSTSAFDAKYDNALSSVLQFKQKSGNNNATQGNAILSATDLALTLDGPISKKTTYLASARRSYLQFLFQALDLPIRPNYWDFQFKTNTKIDDKTTLSFIGLGAIDEFRFAAPKEASLEKLYVLNSNPLINQWNYTFGTSLKRLTKNGFWNLALSRNMLDNQLDKYENNNTPSETTRTLLTDSREAENKLRFDVSAVKNGWKINYGASTQYVDFKNEFFALVRKQIKDANGNVIQNPLTINSVNSIDFLKYGAFVQVSKKVFNERMSMSLGTRIDGNSLSSSESNPFKQFSPRLSFSFAATEKLNLNASVGRYFKLPSYTQLGYGNIQSSSFVKNPGEYISSNHYVTGIEYIPNNAFRLTVEGFYKYYSNYPVSIIDGVSLANKGAEIGSVGNEPVVQVGNGKAYGMELLMQKKLTKRFFGILSYTYYHSTFTDKTGKYIPASWDNRHLLSITWGYKFRKNWELGMKFRYQGAAPYTPFDMVASRINYLTQGVGIFNNGQYNTLRLKPFNSGDVRIDKKWNFNKFTLDLFMDVSNWYASKISGVPEYTFGRTADGSGFTTTDGKPIKLDGSNAIPVILPNVSSITTPSFGFIIEF
ncbi:MAG: TonB-dependent receptor [Chitinophagia bacterium]|nr:TonB-dependent receptor [Chitinophagia bacterium]